MNLNLLENIVWHSLSGPHQRFSAGSKTARRYAPGFSQIIGFADLNHPDFDSLAGCCQPGEKFYCGGITGKIPCGWQVETEAIGCRMVWDGMLPAGQSSIDAIPLTPAHVPQIMELVALTHPGPFGERTIELGEYFGVFERGRFIAMAGERMTAGRLREISGVCTHPDFQGRGLARRLIEKLIRRELERKEIPFLHVMKDNEHARRLYEKIGFRLYREVSLNVVSRA